ncbi:MAG: carbohydrate binding family 9 domain-containing protein, partial [bacterium]
MSFRGYRSTWFFLTLLFSIVPILHAADDDDAKNDLRSTSPVMSAVKVDLPPALDGDVLGEPVWQAVEPATGFWQTTPDEGQPASEETEVRIVYTNKTLYVGVVCYDRDPQHIVVSDSRRDGSLENTDSFQILLDTYNDNQNGFLFGTNPAGVEYDAQINNEGQNRFGGRRQQRGAVSGFNINWDGS